MNNRINTQLLVNITAIIFSGSALTVSIRQMQISREQQRASAWPRLYMSNGVVDRNFTLSLVNQGVGPAIIKTVQIRYQGKPYPALSKLLLGRFKAKLVNGGFYFGDLKPDMVLRAGEEFPTFALVKNDEPLSLDMNRIITDSSFHYRIQYADVYGNCWQMDCNHVTPLGQCAEAQ
jgi:hypothetical protein